MRRKFEKLLAKELGLNFPDHDPVWCDAREVLITGGIRAGKSLRMAFKAFCKMLEPQTRLIWLVGPDYVQAREEFRYILEWGLRLGIIKDDAYSVPQDGPRALTTITGCRVETKSAQHAERLASVAPDMVLLCEPGQMPSEVYEAALGRLLQKRGMLFMAGTLESDLSKPRWQWYEDLANDWADHDETSRQRSFTLPTWTNTIDYPEGLADPELQHIKSTISEYSWNRKYAGIPTGVSNPVFPMIWEMSTDELLRVPPEGTRFVDGAIGVDYGTTWEHPSAVVVIGVDEHDNYWVREGWQGFRVGINVIQDVVDTMKHNYRLWQGMVDPNQAVLGDLLRFQVAAGGATGGQPTEMRFKLANELLESRRFYFDIEGPCTRDVLASMRLMGHIVDARGQRRYARPLGDDFGQAAMYAIEQLRTSHTTPIPVTLGSARMIFHGGSSEEISQGRA